MMTCSTRFRHKGLQIQGEIPESAGRGKGGEGGEGGETRKPHLRGGEERGSRASSILINSPRCKSPNSCCREELMKQSDAE
jgi:hypothetical protein